jgi:methionine salvage enolase-phosphatase E1
LIKYLIFDLSEVLIRGILGVERKLSEKLQIPEKIILKSFACKDLESLCLGNISETEYLNQIIKSENWPISISELKILIRDNFKIEISQMVVFIKQLKKKYILFLCSDHCREWIEYIEEYHSFLELFSRKYYSYETKSLKSDEQTFLNIIWGNKLHPEEIVFIDDNPFNTKTAEKVNIHSIIFQNYQQLKNELSFSVKK